MTLAVFLESIGTSPETAEAQRTQRFAESECNAISEDRKLCFHLQMKMCVNAGDMRMNRQFSPITLGERLRTITAGGFVLTETVHPPNQQLSRHSHELTNIAFVLNGSFTEVLGRKSIECRPQSLLIKPAGETHANIYGRAGVRCLLIELQRQQVEALQSWSKGQSGKSRSRR